MLVRGGWCEYRLGGGLSAFSEALGSDNDHVGGRMKRRIDGAKDRGRWNGASAGRAHLGAHSISGVRGHLWSLQGILSFFFLLFLSFRFVILGCYFGRDSGREVSKIKTMAN